MLCAFVSCSVHLEVPLVIKGYALKFVPCFLRVAHFPRKEFVSPPLAVGIPSSRKGPAQTCFPTSAPCLVGI